MWSILENIPFVPCHPENRGGKRAPNKIKYIVYHYTGNDGDHDTNNARYYQNNVVGASAHYFVDDDSITRSVEDLTVAWAVGGKKWKDCPQTGGGKLYGIVTNANSISIEMCDTLRDGSLMATEATLSRAAELGKALMAKYNIDIDHVVRHFDVTGKHCPAYFMAQEPWDNFKKRLADTGVAAEDEEEDMTLDKFKELMREYRAELQDNDAGAWSEPAREWAVNTGLVQGGNKDNINGMWEDMLTREQMVTVLYRFAKIMGVA